MSYFIGRKRLVREVISKLTTRQSMELIGPSRIGLTSLLKHLCNLPATPDGFQPIHLRTYVDCKQQIMGAGIRDFFSAIIPPFHQLHKAHPNFPAEPVSFEPEAVEGYFRSIKTGGWIVIFFLDNFHVTAQRTTGSPREFFDQLRGLLTDQLMVFCLTSEGDECARYAPSDAATSPFFNYLTSNRVGLLPDPKSIISQDVRSFFPDISEEVLDIFHALAGRHPVLISAFLSLITIFGNQEVIAQADDTVLTRLSKEFRQEVAEVILTQFQETPPDIKELFRKALLHQKDLSQGNITSWHKSDLDLLQWNRLLVRSEDGGSYRFPSDYWVKFWPSLQEFFSSDPPVRLAKLSQWKKVIKFIFPFYLLDIPMSLRATVGSVALWTFFLLVILVLFTKSCR
ncbi:MAG: hypothetical protein HQK60_13505 [Deltaproteobacteria bacterium]|nr:hypothetical protein [Deltaproteobacteria bacterium]